ncbi:helix-loop-helix protein delilah [Uranotaenia lowii]|uniref:helix-loop-helix protein delilah n=1 Tax=Uranotaenia lowii TaxID=190385 RepID=UPI00247A6998|nr:helix-loop-helix protein delilah [Uranotaenia lowii]
MHHTMEALAFDQIPIMDLADANNNNSRVTRGPGASSSKEQHKKDEKYSLRQRQTRKPTPTAKPEKKTVPKDKPKPKAPPLSKYRRKTANARERTRMREINSAFENLRQAVPLAVAGGSGNSSPVSSPGNGAGSSCNEKLTKITTLRLAMKYIRILKDILNNSESGLMIDNNNDLDMVNHNEIEREVMLKGLLQSESIFKPISPVTVKQQATEKSPSRRSNSNASKKKPRKASKASSTKKSTSNTRSSRQTTIKPEAPSIDTGSELMDLGMMLDSDNDSLHLSEPCMSPLQTTAPSLKQQTFNSCNVSNTANDLEFGLFLESDADSLQLSEPCLSPLGNLDSLNPFNDLLHTGFNEQTALELYL